MKNKQDKLLLERIAKLEEELKADRHNARKWKN